MWSAGRFGGGARFGADRRNIALVKSFVLVGGFVVGFDVCWLVPIWGSCVERRSAKDAKSLVFSGDLQRDNTLLL